MIWWCNLWEEPGRAISEVIHITSGVLIGTEGGKDMGKSCILHFTYDGINGAMEKTAGISKVSLKSSLTYVKKKKKEA